MREYLPDLSEDFNWAVVPIVLGALVAKMLLAKLASLNGVLEMSSDVSRHVYTAVPCLVGEYRPEIELGFFVVPSDLEEPLLDEWL